MSDVVEPDEKEAGLVDISDFKKGHHLRKDLDTLQPTYADNHMLQIKKTLLDNKWSLKTHNPTEVVPGTQKCNPLGWRLG